MFKLCFSFQAFCRQTNRKSLNHNVSLILKRRILFFGHISEPWCAYVCRYVCICALATSSGGMCWQDSCGDLRKKVERAEKWQKESQHVCIYMCVCVCACVCKCVCEPVWPFISQARTEKDVSPLPPLPLHLLNHPSCCLFLLFAYFIIHISIALCGSYRLYTLTTEL